MEASLRTLFLAAVLASVSGSASAGPLEGDLFGYRLGTKYVIGPDSKGYFMGIAGSVVLMAEKPLMSSDFERVEPITTPQSFHHREHLCHCRARRCL